MDPAAHLLKPKIRRATRADERTLAQISEETFVETFVEGFGVPYPPADLAAFVEDAHSRAAFLKMLADPAKKLWLAEAPGGRAVGYAVAGPCKLPHPDVGSADAEISRLYLRNEAQGSGLGRRLLETVLAGVDPNRTRSLWLSVWEGNDRAQAFYARYGFEVVGEWAFPVGKTLDRDLIMRRRPA